MAKPESALFFALITTIGSTLGGMFGYGIGYVGEKAVLIKFFSQKNQKLYPELNGIPDYKFPGDSYERATFKDILNSKSLSS